MRERRGRDTQQRAPGRDSNPGPLQRGQSLCALPTELNSAACSAVLSDDRTVVRRLN